jgi:3-methyladenine DNA glycosylase AlkD
LKGKSFFDTNNEYLGVKGNELMSGNDLAATIRRFCAANANPAIVKKYSRYFREGYDAYGLDSKAYDACMTMLSEDDKLKYKNVMKAAPELIGSGKYEETFFVIVMLRRLFDEFTSKTFKEIEKWYKVGIVNWAQADVMAGDVIAVFLQREIVPLSALESWRTGTNKFQRRTVPVTLIKLLKDNKDVKPLIAFVEPLMTDPEREVHQGIGWFLREAWKVKKADTEKFLLKWKNTAPRLIFQYATEKMTPAEKARFRKSQ